MVSSILITTSFIALSAIAIGGFIMPYMQNQHEATIDSNVSFTVKDDNSLRKDSSNLWTLTLTMVKTNPHSLNSVDLTLFDDLGTKFTRTVIPSSLDVEIFSIMWDNINGDFTDENGYDVFVESNFSISHGNSTLGKDVRVFAEV